MEERRKINQQHKHKDKRRNAKSQVQPNAQKTTQSQKPTATTTGTKKAPPPVASDQRSGHNPNASSSSSSSDSDDPYSSRQFSKRTIVKNWDKYDNVDAGGVGSDSTAVNAEHYEQMSAADFGQLLRAPAAEGAHFRFSSERNWDADESSADLFGTQFFRMNVSQMERQLLAVPFHERQQYAAELFTADELQHMRAEARAYSSVPVGSSKRIDPAAEISKRKLTTSAQLNDNLQPEHEIQTSAAPSVVAAHAEEVDAELDSLLSAVSMNPRPSVDVITDPAVEQSPSVQLASQKTIAPVDDLQQWLDDILDD